MTEQQQSSTYKVHMTLLQPFGGSNSKASDKNKKLIRLPEPDNEIINASRNEDDNAAAAQKKNSKKNKASTAIKVRIAFESEND